MKKKKRTKNNIFSNYNRVAPILLRGGIGVLKTDTIYGLVGLALNKKTINRIYKVRKREKNKPMIILISSIDDLKTFGIIPDQKLKIWLNKYWPGKISVILPCRRKKFFHLHRGRYALAFRYPDKQNLLNLLRKTGPLAAPSANISGEPPAENIKKAVIYFQNRVDFYV
ncbi:MAG TPA: L-threonylcarbamoyladenylate synthase, partial [Patescibacteria group bacterium]|nr:L-threonylcarbamoyladenylate synthase [Patescibacteria group bacterium]